MQNMYLPTSKLYYEIIYLSRKGIINDIERKALKKLVIIDNEQIFHLIEEFNQGHLTEQDLQENLVALSREVDMKSDTNEETPQIIDVEFNLAEAQKVAEYIQKNPEIPDEIASPLGAQLWRRRRNNKFK